MNKERELIERDQKYQRLKRWIIHIMDNTEATPWKTENEWIDYSQLSQSEYHRIVRDMLDDSELKREYDRDATPHKTRWVMKERKEKHGQSY